MASIRVRCAAPRRTGYRSAVPLSPSLRAGLAVAVAILTLSTLSLAMLVHASRSAATAAVAAAALPPGVAPVHRRLTAMDASALDGGVRSLVALDRRDGLLGGTLREYRDGARQLRLWTRIYRTRAGAAHAYGRAAGFLRRVLPDPVLRARIETVGGIGAAATLAAYRSVFGHLHYSAGALVTVDGTIVCEAQAFPLGLLDGNPARDPRDLMALARRCLALAGSSEPPALGAR